MVTAAEVILVMRRNLTRMFLLSSDTHHSRRPLKPPGGFRICGGFGPEIVGGLSPHGSACANVKSVSPSLPTPEEHLVVAAGSSHRPEHLRGSSCRSQDDTSQENGY